jgi:pimeloyl-ACP methyl ester carboxylesterase
VTEIRVASWGELQEVLFADSWIEELGRHRSRCAYRGLSDASYPLQTALMRMGGRYAQLEKHLLRNFRKYAHRRVVERDSMWHWLSVAQHYGLPTRLLDWTYSPFAALHFATAHIDKFDIDGVIWSANYLLAHELVPDVLRRRLESLDCAPSAEHSILLPDGRRLAYAEFGDSQGWPLIYCHGFPSSRLEAGLLNEAARRHGVRVIAPDRPGSGRSEVQPGRRLLDWPSDVAALADVLGTEAFHLVGVSGGGPFALACAARLADRLRGVALICSLAPLSEAGMLRAMYWPARLHLIAAHHAPWVTGMMLYGLARPLARSRPERLFSLLLAYASPADHDVLIRPKVRRAITASLAESMRHGIAGVLSDTRIYATPWGFDPADIRVPVQLWHGDADTIVPMEHGRWIAAPPIATGSVPHVAPARDPVPCPKRARGPGT